MVTRAMVTWDTVTWVMVTRHTVTVDMACLVSLYLSVQSYTIHLFVIAEVPILPVRCDISQI